MLGAVGGVGESLLAWVWAPALVVTLAIGLALLAERFAGVQLPEGLLAPLGTCLLVVVVMPLYRASLGAWFALALATALAAAGLWFARRDLRTRLRPGATAAAGLATYLLYLAPVLLAGGWTWTGYNFVNDTAVQMVLADRLLNTGVQLPDTGPATIASSGYLEFVRSYLVTHYPLGSHGLLATMARGMPAPLAAAYQPLGALLGALAAMSLTGIARRDLGGARTAAAVGVAALAANLAFAYALQGNVKEIALVMTIAAAAALGRQVLDGVRPAAHTAMVGICLAAALHVYSAAALPYVGLFVLVLASAVLAQGPTLRRAIPRAIAVGALTVAVGGAVSLVDIADFGRVAQGTFSGEKAASGGTDEFGQLLRPLDFGQVSGVWVDEDYRIPVRAERKTANWILICMSFGLGLLGLGLLAWRRRWGPVLYAAPMLLAIPLVGPRVSSYAEGKTLAMGSTAALLLAGAGVALVWPMLAGWRRLAPLPIAAIAAAVGAGVLFSDAQTYRASQLAPIERMEAMTDVAERFRGQKILNAEHEEFAKVFMADTQVNVALETVGANPIYQRLLIGTYGRRADLDQYPLADLQGYPVLMQRKGADMARAPANYELAHENAVYRVWRRMKGPVPAASLPLLGLYVGAGTPDCGAVESLASQAQPGDRMVAATAPDEIRLEVASLDYSPGWRPHQFLPNVLTTSSPGEVSETLTFERGSYEIWLQASTGRDFEVEIDGRPAGNARGIENAGLWLPAGTVDMPGGHHRVTVRRPGGGLAPGDRAPAYLGPVVFRRSDQPVQLVTAAPSRASATFCDRRWDWIELVR